MPNFYRDPIQEGFRKVISRALIRTFNLFTYVLDPASGKYFPHFQKPVDSCKEDVIKILDCEVERFITAVEDDIELEKTKKDNRETVLQMQESLRRFNSACATISMGHLGRIILDTTHAFRANKNWNSHGAAAGAAVLDLGCILSSLKRANQGLGLEINHNELIPKGEIQTGAKHGNHNISYVEYMCSSYEKNCEFGTEHMYLNHPDFRRKKHDLKVNTLMSEKVPGMDVPASRPTRAHTFDFNLNFCGARLIDGECKDKAFDAEKGVLTLHSLDQLVYKECAHSLLTTNTCFTLIKCAKNRDTGRIETHQMEMPKYRLGGVSSLDPADDPDACHKDLEYPPPYLLCQNGFAEKTMYEDDAEIMRIWTGMRSEQRRYLRCIIATVDFVCGLVTDMPLSVIRQRRQIAYEGGWVEPFFVETSKSDLKSHRPIREPERFIYCRKNMESAEETALEEKMAKQMYDDYKKLLESDMEMSPEFRSVVENAMKAMASKAKK